MADEAMKHIKTQSKGEKSFNRRAKNTIREQLKSALGSDATTDSKGIKQRVGEAMKPMQEAKVEELKASPAFKQLTKVYAGYVDDPRNTDNAWMETQVFHMHLDDETLKLFQNLRAGDDASGVQWLEVTEKNIKGLYASHPDFVKEAHLL